MYWPTFLVGQNCDGGSVVLDRPTDTASHNNISYHKSLILQLIYLNLNSYFLISSRASFNCFSLSSRDERPQILYLEANNQTDSFLVHNEKLWEQDPQLVKQNQCWLNKESGRVEKWWEKFVGFEERKPLDKREEKNW